MTEQTVDHSHVFLAESHERSERKTWAVIWLCGLMMLAEIIGGTLFGSMALVADGLHMSTHAGALLIAAMAYTYARRHASDTRFSFGTGKLGDLAGFTSAVILAMIALLIGYESISRLLSPVAINFSQAIPIAVVGLGVNIASAWLLSGGDHGHSHGHGHDAAEDDAEVRRIKTNAGTIKLEVYEDGVPPRFRIRLENGTPPEAMASLQGATIETRRPDGKTQLFRLSERGDYCESIDEIPEPHEFEARLTLPRPDGPEVHDVAFEEHDHGHEPHGGKTHQDNNFRAALVHVLADAAVSVLVIFGLILARRYGWLWIDPAVGIVGALVIANWSFGLIRDTGAILLDMNADGHLAEKIRNVVEINGDRLADLHLWRLGPGHLGAIVSIETTSPRSDSFYRGKLSNFNALSHLTLELRQQGQR